MRKILTLLISFLSVFSLSAQEGKSSFDFLQLPASVRGAAIGGTNVSIIENDLSLVFLNPAFLGQEMDLTFSASYLSYIGDINAGNVAFAKAIGERSAFGAGFVFSNYGKMLETSEDNVILGDLKATDVSGNIFFSRDLTETIRGGVNAKFIYSNYAYNTSIGLGVDLGLSYYNRDNGFSVGLAGKNLGRQVKAYETELGELPWDIQLGISKKLAHAPIRFSVTGVHLKKWKFDPSPSEEEDTFSATLFKHLVFGIEFLLSDNFWLGAGYNRKLASDLHLKDANKFAGFSVGAGLRVKSLGFGCSFGQYHPSATSFMLNISTCLAEMKL